MNYLSLLYDDMNERLDKLKGYYVRTVKAISLYIKIFEIQILVLNVKQTGVRS